MVKKVKEEDFVDESHFDIDAKFGSNSDEDEDVIDESEEDLDLDLDEGEEDLDLDDDIPENPMGLAHQISKESAAAKNFKELSREVKYSFLDGEDKREVKHFANTYRNWKYIEKIIDLRGEEDIGVSDHRQNLVLIKDANTLKTYFEDIGRHYLVTDIEDLEEEDLKKLVEHVKTLKENKFLQSLDNKKERMKNLYEDYNELHKTPDYIDDMGNMGKIMNTSITSMGYKGNAAKHSVMTINAVRNEDIQRVSEEKAEFSFMDAFKKKFG